MEDLDVRYEDVYIDLEHNKPSKKFLKFRKIQLGVFRTFQKEAGLLYSRVQYFHIGRRQFCLCRVTYTKLDCTLCFHVCI